ncbi:sirohydrochlorin chelatase [Noviherbaspirillum pedocola]|uniref:CbiX/SirB N-terminal domain-containing protein n=1 Tax=Noviherbaspirillum pedocola TaxID=2801341 RepID=A0A934SRG9_9BURK|nr:CbiX/SirB N-terminal domain-containing protein [Noviherbaspirillum pedocola]MBK4734212.1 CbiX/SirB N-terminal domain-containing protein [Noviherbaspirillum pedocola]
MKALILFAHGARDPRWAAPFERLRELLRAQMPESPVELAFLELMSPRLPETVARLAEGACERIDVVPVFFGQGGHVLRDLPPMVDELRATYPGIDIRVAQAVGESPEVLAAIARYCIANSEAP